jgi:hypothetical protein
MEYNVLIVGGGNIGSRHLQGLSKSDHKLSIHIYDISSGSLAICKERWDNVSDATKQHRVYFYDSLENIPNKILLCINAVPSDGRFDLIKTCSELFDIKYLIVEKFLFQNIDKYSACMNLIDVERTWVNTNFGGINMLNEVLEKFYSFNNLSIEIKPTNWGMACNAIHFLDWVTMKLNTSIDIIDSDNLTDWQQSKRKDYYEVYGEINVLFKNNINLILKSISNNNQNLIFSISDKTQSWEINWDKGQAIGNSNEIINKKILFQSEITGSILDSLINNHICNLTPYKVSSKNHRLLVDVFIRSWNKRFKTDQEYIPIT